MYTLFHSAHELLFLLDSDPRVPDLVSRAATGDAVGLPGDEDRWRPRFSRLFSYPVSSVCGAEKSGSEGDDTGGGGGGGGPLWVCCWPRVLMAVFTVLSFGFSVGSTVRLAFFSAWGFDDDALCTTYGDGSYGGGGRGPVAPLVGISGWMRSTSIFCFTFATISGLAALGLALGGFRKLLSLVVRHALQLYLVTRREVALLLVLRFCAAVAVGGYFTMLPRTIGESLFVPAADLASESMPVAWLVRLLFLSSAIRHMDAWVEVRLYAASCEHIVERDPLATEVHDEVVRSIYLLSTIALVGLFLLRMRRPRVTFVQVPRQISAPRRAREPFVPYVVSYGPYGVRITDAECGAGTGGGTGLGASATTTTLVESVVETIVDTNNEDNDDEGDIDVEAGSSSSGNMGSPGPLPLPPLRMPTSPHTPPISPKAGAPPPVTQVWVESNTQAEEESKKDTGSATTTGTAGTMGAGTETETETDTTGTGAAATAVTTASPNQDDRVFSKSGSWTVHRPRSPRMDAAIALGAWITAALYFVRTSLHIAAIFGTPSAGPSCFGPTPSSIDTALDASIIASQVTGAAAFIVSFVQFAATVRRPFRTVVLFCGRWLCSHQIFLMAFVVYAVSTAAAGTQFHAQHATAMVLYPLADIALLYPNIHRGDGGGDDGVGGKKWSWRVVRDSLVFNISAAASALFTGITLLMLASYARHSYLQANMCSDAQVSSLGSFFALAVSDMAHSSWILAALRLSLVKVWNGSLSTMGFTLEPGVACQNDWAQGARNHWQLAKSR